MVLNWLSSFGGNNNNQGGGAAPAPAATPTAGAPAVVPGAAPAAAPVAGIPAPAASPLDQLSVIWNNNDNGGNNKGVDFSADVITYTPEQQASIQQKVGSINFLGAVKPEQISAALGGDVEAFSGVINTAVQAALLQSMRMSVAMVNAGTNKRFADVNTLVPNLVREHLVTSQIRQDNPLLQHPAVQPLVSVLEAQVSRNQNLSPQQASQVVRDYLQTLFTEVVPASASKPASSTGPVEQDWSAVFNTR